VYVNGRWILANDHVFYKIVRSTLPTDGDYMGYFKELQLHNNQKNSITGASGNDEEKLMLTDDLHYLNASGSSGSSGSSAARLQSSPININSGQIATATAMLSASTLGGMGANAVRSIDRRSILSGLTLTVQFVNLIAFYLNIVLPYNLPHKYAQQKLTI
jgi:hypothetical protein